MQIKTTTLPHTCQNGYHWKVTNQCCWGCGEDRTLVYCWWECKSIQLLMKIFSYYGKGCILSPCLFNLYAEYIIWNARLDEEQAGIKTAERNINNLRYADGTTLMAESKEELKSLVMKVKEESEKAGLKLNIQKTKIMASSPICSVQFSSVAQSCPTLCDPMDCSTPGVPSITNSWSLLKLRSIELVMQSNPLLLCRALLLLLQSFPASGSFPMNQFCTSGGQSIEYSGLISFRTEWLDLLAVQGTLKSLLQHDSPITLWQINGETMKTVRDFTFLGLEY